jgi:uncharacterized membrane protein YeaQ/YmgE (transglycosylase-associated protein family)
MFRHVTLVKQQRSCACGRDCEGRLCWVHFAEKCIFFFNAFHATYKNTCCEVSAGYHPLTHQGQAGAQIFLNSVNQCKIFEVSVGGIVGGWVVSLLGIGGGGLIWTILVSILGAVILIWLTRLVKKAV